MLPLGGVGAGPGGMLRLEATGNMMAPKSGTVAVAAAKSLVDGDPVSLLEGGTPAASSPVDDSDMCACYL